MVKTAFTHFCQNNNKNVIIAWLTGQGWMQHYEEDPELAKIILRAA